MTNTGKGSEEQAVDSSLGGIHHITALASNAQRNIDFYAGFLGLRLVKKTVNFDAPDVYHLYYGDGVGTPGTLLTFFPFPDAMRGKRGTGEATAVALSIRAESVDYWIDRLATNALHFDGPEERLGETVLSFEDPDGMLIELVTNSNAQSGVHWAGSPVDNRHAIRGLHGTTLQTTTTGPTESFLRGVMGFHLDGAEGGRRRYSIGEGQNKAMIDLIGDANGPGARMSAGSIHHIAWRVSNDTSQIEWRKRLLDTGANVTTVQERQYFRSIYFREPGGVLYEIATDTPGFLVDESLEELGTGLKLPPWLESRRKRIEETLLPISALATRVPR